MTTAARTSRKCFLTYPDDCNGLAGESNVVRQGGSELKLVVSISCKRLRGYRKVSSQGGRLVQPERLVAQKRGVE